MRAERLRRPQHEPTPQLVETPHAGALLAPSDRNAARCAAGAIVRDRIRSPARDELRSRIPRAPPRRRVATAGGSAWRSPPRTLPDRPPGRVAALREHRNARCRAELSPPSAPSVALATGAPTASGSRAASHRAPASRRLLRALVVQLRSLARLERAHGHLSMRRTERERRGRFLLEPRHRSLGRDGRSPAVGLAPALTLTCALLCSAIGSPWSALCRRSSRRRPAKAPANDRDGWHQIKSGLPDRKLAVWCGATESFPFRQKLVRSSWRARSKLATGLRESLCASRPADSGTRAFYMSLPT
jgi:hypothetical protein